MDEFLPLSPIKQGTFPTKDSGMWCLKKMATFGPKTDGFLLAFHDFLERCFFRQIFRNVQYGGQLEKQKHNLGSCLVISCHI